MDFKFLTHNIDSSENIPIPPTITRQYDKVLFVQGWLAYQRGVDEHECPYTTNENKRMWIHGYTQSSISMRLPNDENLYLRGWSAARRGYPLHSNPYLPGSHTYTMWNTGWNDFVSSH